MESLQYYRNLFNFPASILLKKLQTKLRERKYDSKQKPLDCKQSTRIAKDLPLITRSYINTGSLDLSKIDLKTASWISDRYLEHRFDLLGSGWVDYGYQSQALGFEGHQYNNHLPVVEFDVNGNWLEKVLLPAHFAKSKSIWQQIIATDPSYQPIEWQKDAKSGFRFSARNWYKDQASLTTGKKYVDIKMPWELSRMQHLPQLGLFAHLLPSKKEAIIKEFKCQVLDFVTANPPRMGVNWTMAMDVGIRAANWLLAYDIFIQLDDGSILDDDFKQTFANTIYDHAIHLVQNLEYKEGLHGNHYLANICGLLYIASYVECNEESDCWLALSVQELLECMGRQFYDDGGNFESSVYYHRLGTEMMVFGASIIVGLGEDKRKALKRYDLMNWKFIPALKPYNKQDYDIEQGHILPAWFWDRLTKAGDLAEQLCKPNSTAPQFGDNDSGRFFRFSPVGNMLKVAVNEDPDKNENEFIAPNSFGGVFWEENQLDFSALLAALDGLLSNGGYTQSSNQLPLEKSLLAVMSKNKKPGVDRDAFHRYTALNKQGWDLELKKLTYHETASFENKSSVPLTEGLNATYNDGFQLAIFRSPSFYLAFYIVANPKQIWHWAHSHNDKLSVELNMDGKDILVDPGSYVYGALPERRNEFRSMLAHNVPVVEGEEQNRWEEGKSWVFHQVKDSRTEFLEHTASTCVARLSFRGIVQIRKIEILPEMVKIDDYCNRPFRQNWNRGELYSRGYGKLDK